MDIKKTLNKAIDALEWIKDNDDSAYYCCAGKADESLNKIRE